MQAHPETDAGGEGQYDQSRPEDDPEKGDHQRAITSR
jgi:hypothetical protein